jgi:hypothetical protein
MVSTLPAAGIITVKDLAEFLGNTSPSSLMQRLSDKGIPVLKLSAKFDQRLVRLEDLRNQE